MTKLVPAALSAFFVASTLCAAPSYTVRDLLSFSGDPSEDNKAWGINASGEITGQGRIPGTFSVQGYRTLPGGTILTSTPLTESIGNEINSRGEIAGVSLIGSIATLTRGTTTTFLGNFASETGGATYGYGLNNLQFGPDQFPQVVGQANQPSGAHYAFLWQAGATHGYAANPEMRDLGSMVPLALQGVHPYDHSLALAINDSQQVVGWSKSQVRYAFVQNNPTVVHAFLWTADGTAGPPENPQMRDLGTLGPVPDVEGQENNSQAHDINNVGQVTGFSSTLSVPTGGNVGQAHAFIWSEATGMVDIDPGSNRFSYGQAINNHGDVVGIMTIPDGTTHAFVYTEGQMWDLNDLIPPGSGWNLKEAHDINDAGEIIGWGDMDGHFRPFALTGPPPPEVPASSAAGVAAVALLLLAGVTAVVLRRPSY